MENVHSTRGTHQKMAGRSKFRLRPHTFHSWNRVASRFELVLRKLVAQKDGRFGEQLQVVGWTGEVQDTKAVNILLVLGRDGNPEDRALDIVGDKQVEGIKR